MAVQPPTGSKDGRNLRSGTQAPVRCGLPKRPAGDARGHRGQIRPAGDDRELQRRIEIDDACPGRGFAAGKTGRDPGSKVPFVAAVQATADGRPLQAGLNSQPPTRLSMAAFAARRIARSATPQQDPRRARIGRVAGGIAPRTCVVPWRTRPPVGVPALQALDPAGGGRARRRRAGSPKASSLRA
jgi:hypothetical protein